MAYQLFVTGNYGLSHRIFPTLKDIAETLKGPFGQRPFEFTIQCFGKDGKFARAFGGIAQPDEISYNGHTSGDRTVRDQMRRFAGYMLGENARLIETRFGGNIYSV